MEPELRVALIIAEEILNVATHPNNNFEEQVHDYICDKLDMSDEELIDALDVISKENENSSLENRKK